jgi:hypothetical protein
MTLKELLANRKSERPTYTFVAVSKSGRASKFTSSKGGEKIFSNKWIEEMIEAGNAKIDGTNTLTFVGNLEEEF